MSKVMQCNGCGAIAANGVITSEVRLFLVDMPVIEARAERLAAVDMGPEKKWKVNIRLDSSGEDLCRACSHRLLAYLSHQWLEPEEEEDEE